MPTINQLVREGRTSAVKKSTAPALNKGMNSLRRVATDTNSPQKRGVCLSLIHIQMCIRDRYKAARDSGVVILAKASGTVEFVDADSIVIRRDDNNQTDVYPLLKFKRSNQGTCINQRPIVSHGEHIEEGEVIADGPSTDQMCIRDRYN